MPDLEILAITCAESLWVVLRGEADISNHQQLRDELARVDLASARDVHVLLGQLGFCDLLAFRELLAFGRAVRQQGLDFSFEEAGPPVQRVARLLHLDGEPGLV